MRHMEGWTWEDYWTTPMSVVNQIVEMANEAADADRDAASTDDDTPEP
jgi:hypothetical protein